MNSGPLITHPDQVSATWLSQVLQQRVDITGVLACAGNWSGQWLIKAQTAAGTTLALRLKLCVGATFGRSEVDYYTRDYQGLVDAPLVPCFDAHHQPGVGYHLLLQDLGDTHVDNKQVSPGLSYGLAVAEALGRLHRHHWCTQPVPRPQAINRYFDEISPGLVALEQATGCALREGFERHEQAFRQRWARPQGMTLLHGDLNPTNILSPAAGPATPVYFLDRQPFEWSLTYGVAASDLAHFMVPWWPPQTRQACEQAVLRRWWESLGVPGYSWNEAQADWQWSVEQCLHVPMEWCSKPATLQDMQGLWRAQFARVQAALGRQ